ncbi:MAG: xanthine dehydrogenase accessory protein XdhC [Flavobacteriaceae bacterium]
MQDWISKAAALKEQGIPFALITVTGIKGSAPCKLGGKMIVLPQGEIHGTIGGGKLEFQVIDHCVSKLQKDQKEKVESLNFVLGPDFEQCCGGQVELLMELHNTNPQLFICGAGHIGLQLARIMVDSPFDIKLLDTRPNWASKIEIPLGVAFLHYDFDLYKTKLNWQLKNYIIILTHDHQLDFEITALALEQKSDFIGLIGSKTKAAKFDSKFRAQLPNLPGMSEVHCPVGLDLGGQTPNEIAISVAAQLLKTHYGH